jgi:hypothetical protein
MWTVFFLLISTVTGFSTVYDDTYARRLIRINGAAYSDDPATCIKNIKGLTPGWQLVTSHETSCSTIPFLKATCAYIILKNRIKKQYIISFRGTVGRDQLISQFLSSRPARFEKYGNVNTYFQKAFKELW